MNPSVQPSVDLEQARRFIEALTGNVDASATWQTFDDDTTRKDPALAVVMHGTLAGCADELADLNARGAGIFVTVNQTDGHGRKAENVTDLRALFVDKDTGLLGPLALEPAIRVRTVQGEHAYWLLKPGEFRDEFRNAQKRLIRALDTDPSIIDLSRVMRVPGFLHCKGSPKEITCTIGDLTKRSIPDVLKAFPLLRAVKENDSAPRRSKRDRFDEAVAKLGTAKENRNDTLFRTARIGRDLVRQGTLTEDEVEDACLDACLRNGLTSEEDAKTINTLTRALTDDGSWEASLMVNDKGVPAANLGNATIILANHAAWTDVLALDVRNAEMFFKAEPPWATTVTGGRFPRACEDGDETLCTTWFSRFQRMGLQAGTAMSAMIAVAKRDPFDPVVDYLDAQKWDGVPRAETWLIDLAGATGPEKYLRAVSKRWLIAAVARAMSPGCQADSMLILEGDQEAGKTSLGRVMGGAWFAEKPPKDVSGQKMQEFIRGPWIIEFGELSAFKKAEVEDVKAFITNLVDRYRPAYGRVVGTFPRRCIFLGSTNKERYFTDATGNRRFWPVKCGAIDVAGLRAVRDQLWAEAVALYDAGEPWELTAEEKLLAKDEQAERFVEDALESAIVDALENGVKGGGLMGQGGAWAIKPKAESVSVLEILTHVCRDTQQRDRGLQVRIGEILTSRLKWVQRRTRDGGVRERRYFRPNISGPGGSR